MKDKCDCLYFGDQTFIMDLCYCSLLKISLLFFLMYFNLSIFANIYLIFLLGFFKFNLRII